MDHLFSHHHGVIGTPGFRAALRNRVALRNLVEALEHEFAGNMSLIFRKDLLAEVLLKILTDHPNDLAEACLNSIIDTVVHNGLAVWPQTV